jgi:antitoxin (DNA-binding transcriptional repressor) of toxin-antitoxin stability system
MKRITASEARRNWFRLLDEVAAGSTVVIERAGRRILLRAEEDAATTTPSPDYRALIGTPESVDAGRADRWGWAWSPDSADVSPEDDDSA